ncbi:MAG TPA: GNAT family N-acetyltransferase [Candidatus Eisenbacteria bacterium]|nr:GNAT family N-acetyltransferase [Candidatus Eisenbacteria bacterium]
MGALEPVTLEGRHVRLEPLSPAHRDDLAAVAFDPYLWRFTLTRILSLGELDAYIATAISWREAGTALPFATVDRSTGRAIGSTRLAHIDREHRHAEIGWTWLGRDYQRKAFNTEAKLLMLTHAFDVMGCIRVELRTDVQNNLSRAAIARLGAREEGIMRNHMIRPDGYIISWVYFSILREEWPEVRAGLEQKLAAHAARV